MKHVDYLIIGQGIAGTLLASDLIKRNKSFVVFDADESSTASKITSGLINPVTGRKFIRSWKSHVLYQVAEKMYSQVTHVTGRSYFHPTTIRRVMMNKQSEDLWLERVGQEYYTDLLSKELFKSENLKIPSLVGVTYHAARIYIEFLLSDMRAWLLKHNRLVLHKLMAEDIDLVAKKVRDYSFEHIIDCSGVGKVLLNGLEPTDELKPNSGERFLVKLENYSSTQIIKAKHFIIPWRDKLYWIGSFNSWKDPTNRPSEECKNELESFLDQWIGSEYEIIDHLSALRLTSKDRRPFVGTHPNFPFVHFINGLGTKGVSLGPYCVSQLLHCLEDGELLDEEIDLKRFI